MVHGAMYDAVNSIDRRHRGYLRVPRAPHWASQDAAAATAAFKVLADQYPAQLATLQTAYDTSLAAIPDGRRKAHGIAAGEAAAAAMLRRAQERRQAGPRRAVPVPDGDRPRRMAPAAAGDGGRPRVVGRQREAVHDPERPLVPHRRPEPAVEPRVRA